MNLSGRVLVLHVQALGSVPSTEQKRCYYEGIISWRTVFSFSSQQGPRPILLFLASQLP
jgi:hypothetical protein